jgi:hypothetical protein
MPKAYNTVIMTHPFVRRLNGPSPSKDSYLRTGAPLGAVVTTGPLYRWVPLHQHRLKRVK